MDLDYFLDQYYQATHIPVSFFQDRALVSKSSLSLQDFNLPLILLNGLSDPLPELWYSYTSEYLYFGGFTIEEEMVFFCRSCTAFRVPSPSGGNHTPKARTLCEGLGFPAGLFCREYIL